MITAFYASILATVICVLSLNVIKTRRKSKVLHGDGDVEELQIARSAQSNAVDYIPIALIMMFLAEYNGLNIWFIHITGIIFTIGRLVHCHGILTRSVRKRVIGMQLTIWTIIALVILNLVCLPYEKFLPENNEFILLFAA